MEEHGSVRVGEPEGDGAFDAGESEGVHYAARSREAKRDGTVVHGLTPVEHCPWHTHTGRRLSVIVGRRWSVVVVVHAVLLLLLSLPSLPLLTVASESVVSFMSIAKSLPADSNSFT